MIFNDRLKKLRTEYGLTQDKVAKELDMPVTTLIKIADFYEVSVDWLMGRTDKREVDR